MREARKRRIGKWIKQGPKECWLASVCMVTGYKFSNARRKRYAEHIIPNRKYSQITDVMCDGLEEPLASMYKAHRDTFRAMIKAGKYRKDRIPAKANGIISVYTHGYQHSVAVVNGIVLDPADADADEGTYSSFAEYTRRNRRRPTIILYEEIRP